MTITPPLAVAAIFYGRFVKNLSTKTQDAIGETTKVAEEKIGNIRTVRAFGMEEMEGKGYEFKVRDVLNLAKKEAYASGAFFGGVS